MKGLCHSEMLQPMLLYSALQNLTAAMWEAGSADKEEDTIGSRFLVGEAGGGKRKRREGEL